PPPSGRRPAGSARTPGSGRGGSPPPPCGPAAWAWRRWTHRPPPAPPPWGRGGAPAPAHSERTAPRCRRGSPPASAYEFLHTGGLGNGSERRGGRIPSGHVPTLARAAPPLSP